MECSEDCKNGVDKPETADDRWHHRDCVNHTTACCGVNDPDDICKCVFVIPVCEARDDHLRRMAEEVRG